jgi:hypothetical protein
MRKTPFALTISAHFEETLADLTYVCGNIIVHIDLRSANTLRRGRVALGSAKHENVMFFTKNRPSEENFVSLKAQQPRFIHHEHNQAYIRASNDAAVVRSRTYDLRLAQRVRFWFRGDLLCFFVFGVFGVYLNGFGAEQSCLCNPLLLSLVV